MVTAGDRLRILTMKLAIKRPQDMTEDDRLRFIADIAQRYLDNLAMPQSGRFGVFVDENYVWTTLGLCCPIGVFLLGTTGDPTGGSQFLSFANLSGWTINEAQEFVLGFDGRDDPLSPASSLGKQVRKAFRVAMAD